MWIKDRDIYIYIYTHDFLCFVFRLLISMNRINFLIPKVTPFVVSQKDIKLCP